jgi:hypothetical protein
MRSHDAMTIDKMTIDKLFFRYFRSLSIVRMDTTNLDISDQEC